jgi:hypothetical protein
MAGHDNPMPIIYLPLVLEGSLLPVSTTQETVIPLPDEILNESPEMAGLEIRVPTGSLFFNNGTPGTMVGLGVVNPNRLPGELPEDLRFPVVITIQTDGATNFDLPVPACFPNLPDPITGEPLPPGTQNFLYSFNHDKGIRRSAR